MPARANVEPSATRPARRPLSRERVLRAAIELADEGGLEAVSMRKLGQVLHVEAMSLYKHVANKDDLLDGMADLITSEFEVPSMTGDWRAAIRSSAISTHEVLLRHPWASTVIESRIDIGPARLRYVEAVIGALSSAGFDLPTVARAFMALDSHTYGFTLQEQSWALDPAEASTNAAAIAESVPAKEYPHFMAMVEAVAADAHAFPPDFAFGLDLILDGLERLRGDVTDQPAQSPSRTPSGASTTVSAPPYMPMEHE